MENDESNGKNDSGSKLPPRLSEIAYDLGEVLDKAEKEGLGREEIAKLLERLATEVRKGHTELPEHRGAWWEEAHEGDDDDVDG